MSGFDRYRKQILFGPMGEQGQQRLHDAKVAVLGCGALGSVIAESLVRAGTGFVRLIDRDFVDLGNLQRQVLYDETDVVERLPKAIAAARKLRRINSEVTMEPRVEDATAANLLDLISGVDLVLDGTDNFETRFLLNDAAVETGIPWVHAGCVGSHGQVMPIVPGRTPCLRCLMPEIPAPGTTETCDTAGVISPAVQVVASLQVVAAFKILTGGSEAVTPELIIVDVWDGSLRTLNLSSLMAHSNCPCCRGRERLWLHGEQGSQGIVLCGRNSVQISAPAGTRISLDELAARWRSLGEVRSNPFLVQFRPREESLEITLFADGRAILGGTEDLSRARGFYSRYVGS